MPKKRTKRTPRSHRTHRTYTPTSGQFDFEPMMPFLRERLDEDHPIYRAALDNDVAGFMAALRDAGDVQLNHDIASELERVSRPPART